MAKNIRGNGDGENGENDSYTIHGRGIVSRDDLVEEVKNGKHPNHHVINRDGDEYVRSNPDCSESNNINKEK
ncbi:DUF3892 domain-containing protein [Photobacterium aphoticum]|uniref:DUF3892 domain-containing protein n=1 Tax=Photobacterium aphoticum TaxID=754436 RepID=A0A0J1GQQ9_9GAMM|nr:DUF3892 domain-containing protein [Photobacterium aphoticum]KLV01991.1 hypothetical protein ABT58_06295 [Photobacterium aphoticum]PSU60237.1 DUF3892 domain-containing protein [Photobacterium aphoticum]GHA34283.1 hypothetical protein GCM10007086_04630 [Photobacterium aphoticum]